MAGSRDAWIKRLINIAITEELAPFEPRTPPENAFETLVLRLRLCFGQADLIHVKHPSLKSVKIGTRLNHRVVEKRKELRKVR